MLDHLPDARGAAGGAAEYTQEILTPISWRTIEAKLPTYDRTAFVASMRVMFDNCLAYNKLADSAPIHWIRDPCRFLYNEFNLLAAKLPPAAGPAEFKAVMEDLKRVRLAGYEPYFDFERNPLEYYSNYTLATRQPMGFLDTLHCRGSFEDWCGLVNEVFDAACRYHCNGRGSAFIFAEAKYLQRQFQAVADVARAVLARGGSAAEVRCDAVEEPAEEGVKVFEVEKTRLSGRGDAQVQAGAGRAGQVVRRQGAERLLRARAPCEHLRGPAARR